MTKNKTITESGMTFTVPENQLFYIEPYIRDEAWDGMKSVEFVWLDNNEMKFIEAKSSTPNSSDPNKLEDLRKFIDDISEKWLNSIHITASKTLGCLPNNPFNLSSWANVQVKLFLVIGNGFKKEWLPPLQDAFNQNVPLKKWQKVWSPKFTPWIKIINEDMARKIGLLANN